MKARKRKHIRYPGHMLMKIPDDKRRKETELRYAKIANRALFRFLQKQKEIKRE